jgi:hypothetical protein
MAEPSTDQERRKLEQNATAYMMMGDLDKPFHRPECECRNCEDWRRRMNRPTHAELRQVGES